MRQVDEVHHAEDERQAGRDQEQQYAELQAVECLDDEEGDAHAVHLSPLPAERGEGAERATRSEAGEGGLLPSITLSRLTPSAFATLSRERERGKKASRAASLHRTILHVRIRVVLEHLLHDLGLEFAVAALRHLHQIEVLNRVMIGVELEGPAQRFEIGLPYGGA